MTILKYLGLIKTQKYQTKINLKKNRTKERINGKEPPTGWWSKYWTYA